MKVQVQIEGGTGIGRGVAMSNDEVLDFDRQLADPYTGRMVDGVRDGRRDSRQPDLADAARSQLVQVRVGEFHEWTSSEGTSALAATI
jgi:hypothetical protein